MNKIPGLEIHKNQSEMNWPWIVGQLNKTYWGQRYGIGKFVYAAQKSTCFGAYINGTQVGFARVVSDEMIFSSLMDVIVEEKWRGRGVGTRMMQKIVDDSSVNITICILASRNAKSLYRRFGFVDIGGNVMQRDPT